MQITTLKLIQIGLL